MEWCYIQEPGKFVMCSKNWICTNRMLTEYSCWLVDCYLKIPIHFVVNLIICSFVYKLRICTEFSCWRSSGAGRCPSCGKSVNMFVPLSPNLGFIQDTIGRWTSWCLQMLVQNLYTLFVAFKMTLSGIMQSVTMFFLSPHPRVYKNHCWLVDCVMFQDANFWYDVYKC